MPIPILVGLTHYLDWLTKSGVFLLWRWPTCFNFQVCITEMRTMATWTAILPCRIAWTSTTQRQLFNFSWILTNNVTIFLKKHQNSVTLTWNWDYIYLYQNTILLNNTTLPLTTSHNPTMHCYICWTYVGKVNAYWMPSKVRSFANFVETILQVQLHRMLIWLLGSNNIIFQNSYMISYF